MVSGSVNQKYQQPRFLPGDANGQSKSSVIHPTYYFWTTDVTDYRISRIVFRTGYKTPEFPLVYWCQIGRPSNGEWSGVAQSGAKSLYKKRTISLAGQILRSAQDDKYSVQRY